MSESEEVAPPFLRDHDDYFESDAWTVVDVDSVDRLFFAKSHDDTVRIDLDGKFHGSAEVGETGERVQVSAWLPREELRDAIAGVLEE